MHLSRKYIVILGIVIAIIIAVVASWWLLSRHITTASLSLFSLPGVAPNTFSSQGTVSPAQQQLAEQTGTRSTIFEISSGPVTGATFIQTTNPTTTLARFMNQNDGHVYDLPLDVPGAIVRPVSDTTIPGTQRTLWAAGGKAVIFQYLDQATIKTVYLAFQTGTSTSPSAAQIQFFPDDIADIAMSPDSSQAAYLLHNSGGGVTGYISAANGTNPEVLFNLPLTQVLLSWPSPTTLLLQSKSADNVPGIVFVVGTKSGSVAQLVYGEGITAIADKYFDELLYQTRFGGFNFTYAHAFPSENNTPVIFDPFPEKCAWSTLATSTIYCAQPIYQVDDTYLDSWHQGTVIVPDDIDVFDIPEQTATGIATPGTNGGEESEIDQLMVSPDNRYLMYVTRGDRSLWGVRLTQ